MKNKILTVTITILIIITLFCLWKYIIVKNFDPTTFSMIWDKTFGIQICGQT